MRKVVSLVFLTVMIISTSVFPVIAGSADVEDVEIQAPNSVTVVDNGSGEYSTSSGKSTGAEEISAKILHKDIYAITDTAQLKDSPDYDKLLKVKEDTYIRVKEVTVELNSTKSIDRIIASYDVNEFMAKDILDVAKKAKDKNVKIIAKIYTPKGVMSPDIVPTEAAASGTGAVASASWSKISGRYYTGYNNAKYMDEVFYTEYVGSMKTVKSGTGTKGYITNTICNYGQNYVDGVLTNLAGPGYTVAKIFFPNISDFSPYPAKQEDFWNAAINEKKYKKYTSVQVYDSSAGKYVYVCRAIGAQEYLNFNHYVFYKALMTSAKSSSDPQKFYSSQNYNSLDRKAYSRMYDSIPYDENFTKWSPNKYTWYTSIN